jgi:hypothetical protein
VLLAYERILERELIREKPRQNDIIVEMIKKYHQEFQFVAISRNHKRDMVLHYLSTSGLLNFFDLIITSSDISAKIKDLQQPNLCVYHETLHRLKCEPSKCLFFDESITEQEKILLPNYQFFDLKSLPGYPFLSLPKEQIKKEKYARWSQIYPWIWIPCLSFLVWYIMFHVFKVFPTAIIRN